MKKFYITTSIAYTNALPHIGFALESIQADVLARYSKSLNKDVFFLTGTDEHGTKIAKAAKAADKSPKEFVDEISNKFRELGKLLNLSNNDFIRTTDEKRHWPVVEKVWKKLEKNKDIYKKQYVGFYCSGCEAFLKTKDLKGGKCRIHLTKPEKISEENYFFKLTKYIDKVRKVIESDKLKVIPETRKNEILSIINQEPEDVSFSRSSVKLNWGIPVPGDDSQKIYVWADALTNYISALNYPNGKQFQKYWPADIHCIGKDILKFHALIWPAMLLALGLELPKKIFVHGFINVNGQKMSKSLGNIIDPFELVNKYGVDAVRYYLLREIPSAEDGDFTYEKFEGRYNSDLAGGIGNLVLRTRTMADSKVSQGLTVNNETKNAALKKEIKRVEKEYTKAIEDFKFNEALKAVWELISYCDKYINDTKPWQKEKGNEKIISDVIFALEKIAVLLQPFLPHTASKVSDQLRNKPKEALFPRIGTK
jgi:methionyl-tRNA synthetase